MNLPNRLSRARFNWTLSRMSRHHLTELIADGWMKPPFPDYKLYGCSGCKWKGWLHHPTVDWQLKLTGKGK